MTNSNTRTRRLSLASRSALLAGLAACTLVTGCSMPDWASMSSAPKPKTKPVAAATSSASAPQSNATQAAATKPKPAPVARGDLKAGSLTRILDAGASKLVITYWTKQNPTTWSAGATVPVQFSAHLEGADSKQDVLVSRFIATLDDGSSVETVSDDKGAFVITPPFSYSGALMIHPKHADATSADLAIEFDLLVETAPNSFQYARQTVLDSVHLTFVTPSSSSSASSSSASSSKEGSAR